MIGVDIELVPKSFTQSGVTWPERARQLVHAHQVLGTKTQPTTDAGFTYHPDSVGIEFATPPCRTASDLSDALHHAVGWLEDLLGYELAYMPGDMVHCSELFDAVAVLDRQALATMMQFGCDPDFIGGAQRDVPAVIKRSDVRELGGHLHVDTTLEPASAADALAHHLLAEYHATAVRGSWYRVPGLYRPKPYGLEYRSLGASWAGQPTLVQEIFERCDRLPH